METYVSNVLRGCVGQTVEEIGTLLDNRGTVEGVRIKFADGTMVQFWYDQDEQEFVIQNVEGCDD